MTYAMDGREKKKGKGLLESITLDADNVLYLDFQT